MIVGRIAKNSYTWYGRQRLEATLEDLQRRGRQQGYHLQMEVASENREAGPGREEDGAEGDAGSGNELINVICTAHVIQTHSTKCLLKIDKR